MLRNDQLADWDRDSFLHPSTQWGAFARGDTASHIIQTAKGCHIVDRDGKTLLDAFAGLYCVNIGYGRSDKKDMPRSPITARLVADLLMTAGVDRVLTVDLHAGQIMGFFSVPVDEISTMGLIADYFDSRNLDLERTTVISPDVGAVRRARDLAEKLHVPLAVIEKRRRRDGPHILSVIGDVQDRDVIVIDDEIDTGGTITEVAHFLKDRGGVGAMYAAAAHGVFSHPARDRLMASPYREVVVTDTLAIPPERLCSKVTILNLGGTIAGVISRIHQGRSVGEFLNY